MIALFYIKISYKSCRTSACLSIQLLFLVVGRRWGWAFLGHCLFFELPWLALSGLSRCYVLCKVLSQVQGCSAAMKVYSVKARPLAVGLRESEWLTADSDEAVTCSALYVACRDWGRREKNQVQIQARETPLSERGCQAAELSAMSFLTLPSIKQIKLTSVQLCRFPSPYASKNWSPLCA